MKNLFGKVIPIFITICLLATACGAPASNNDDQTSAATAAATEATAAATEATAATTAAPAPPSHLTLYFPEQTTPIDLDNVVTNVMEEASNVIWDNVEIGNGSDISMQVNLKLAGGNLADVITLSGNSVIWSRLISENKVIPLDNYFNDEKNYPNLAKIDKRIIDYWRASDGHIYFVPQSYEPIMEEPSEWQGNTNGLWVRDDLLKQAGMTYEDIKTLAGYESFLYKIKGATDSKGRKIIPLELGNHPFYRLEIVMSMFGIVGSITGESITGGWNEQPDGSVIPDYRMPTYKQAWQWLNKMYRDGILDAESTYQSSDLFKEKVTQLRVGSFLQQNWPRVDDPVLQQYGIETSITYAELEKKGFPEDWYYPTYLPTVPDLKQTQLATFNPFGSNGTGVTTLCKNPDAVMKWLDWAQTPEAFILMWWGPESLNAYTITDGKVITNEAVFNGETMWGDTKNVTTLGFWWWTNVASPKATQIPQKQMPWTATNAMLGVAERLLHEQGLFNIVPTVDRVKPIVGGNIEKYTSVQTDIRLKYYAKMMMAKTDIDFNKAFEDFINEMKVRGHDEETITEFDKQYKDYVTTPAGKIKLEVKSYMPIDFYGE